MAKSGFRPNVVTYRQIMNGDAGVISACEIAAHHISASAAAQSGTDYMVDSMRGLNRIHTRVSTVGIKDYMRERHYHALAIACATAGGNATGTKGYGSLMSRVGAVRKSTSKGWKAPGYRRVRTGGGR